MKRFLVLVVTALSLNASLVNAQQKVIPSQCPTIYAGGNFNNAATAALGLSDTALKAYGDAAMPLATFLDTAQYAASAGDSAWLKLKGEYNHVTLEVHATNYTGTSCDSMTVNFWGTAAPNSGVGSYKLLQTSGIGATNENVFQYLPNSGVGNAFTNYRVTIKVADVAGTCKVKWQAWALVR